MKTLRWCGSLLGWLAALMGLRIRVSCYYEPERCARHGHDDADWLA